MARRILATAVALALSVSLVTLLGEGSASAAKSRFTGPALGTVTCTGVTVKVKLKPPATLASGGKRLRIRGKLSSCTVGNLPAGVTEVIHRGGIVGRATGLGGGCQGLIGGFDNPIQIKIRWMGKYNGTKANFKPTTATLEGAVLALDSSAHVGFKVPNPNDSGSSASGSFAGPIADESLLYSYESLNALDTQCARKHGLKKIVLTHGTFTVP